MKINGEQYDYDSMNVESILEQLSVNIETVIVEVDGAIVPRVEFGQYVVDKAATVELVAFVGGG